MPAPFFSVIVPAHNEEPIIAESIRAIRTELGRQDKPFEILIVDDGSCDRTSDASTSALEQSGRVIRLNPNRGKAGAIAEGVTQAKGERILFTDADLSVTPDFFKPMIDRLDESDVVIGSRHLPQSRFLRRQAWLRERCGEGFRLLVRAFLLPNISDFTCGLKAYRADAARHLFSGLVCRDWTFDVEILLRARAAGYRIAEFPVSWTNRPDSRVRLVSAICRSFLSLVKLWKIYGARKS